MVTAIVTMSERPAFAMTVKSRKKGKKRKRFLTVAARLTCLTQGEGA